MKGEEIRGEYWSGFGARSIYRFEDTDGEVLWFEMSGRSKEECRGIKDEWLAEKRANKSLFEKMYAQYRAAYDLAKTLAPGEGVMIRMHGICAEQIRQEYQYHTDDRHQYCLILKQNEEFDWFTHEVYGESPDTCINKMYKYLRGLKDNDHIVQKIEKIIEYKNQ